MGGHFKGGKLISREMGGHFKGGKLISREMGGYHGLELKDINFENWLKIKEGNPIFRGVLFSGGNHIFRGVCPPQIP